LFFPCRSSLRGAAWRKAFGRCQDPGQKSRARSTRRDRVKKKKSMANLYMSVEKLMVSLRDGRKFIGVLRTWDQFGTYSSLLLTASAKLFLESSILNPSSKHSSPVHNRACLRPATRRVILAILPILHPDTTRSVRRYSARHLPCARRECLAPGRDRLG
jgi:hypothetical protein